MADFYQIPTSGKGTLADIRQCMKESGTSKVVTHSVAVRADQVPSINRWLASVISDSIIGFGAIHPGVADPEQCISDMHDKGITGVKIHPDMQGFAIDDANMDPIYELLSQREIPIMIHMGDEHLNGSAPCRLARVMDRFPKLQVVAAHMGGYRRWDEALECLYGRENLFMDTSSTFRFVSEEYAKKLIYAHDSEKLLFATDYPIVTQSEELVQLEKLKLPSVIMDRILYKNAENFFQSMR